MTTLRTIVERIDLERDLEPAALDVIVSGVAGLDQAQAGQLSFLASVKYKRQLAASQASVVLLKPADADLCPDGCIAVQVADPYLAYAQVSQLFDTKPATSGVIHPTAVIADSATLASNVSVGAYAVIGEQVVIDAGAVIGAHSIVEDFAQVGARSELYPRVTIAHHCQLGSDCQIQSGTVIGSNGFGYAPKPGGWQPIAQIGRVIIGDRVHIGANCTIDRGAIADTTIADDAILDNLVQVAHNVSIGKASAMAAQVGVAGSTDIGAGCSFGGQSGITGHISIADNSHFTGVSMVTKGTTEPGLYSSGLPAQSNREWRKMVARIRKLDAVFDRLKDLEDSLKDK